MGSFIPQVVTENTAASAQKIPYSLSFDSIRDTELDRTFPGAGNRQSWTWSCWVKKGKHNESTRQVIFGGFVASSDSGWLEVGYEHTSELYYTSNNLTAASTGKYRDLFGWQHVVVTYDGSDIKFYSNGTLVINDSQLSGDVGINAAGVHRIGDSPQGSARKFNGSLSQMYFIDGQVLNPDNFAFTDPLTDIWRPKKYTGTFTGTNTFYLPFDGNSPIGKDMSGNGNDWTAKNFGVGNFDVSTGAKPILNTSSGCRLASGGVRTFHKTFVVTVQNDGGNKFFFDGVNNTGTTVPLYRGGVYTFDQSDATNGTGGTHPLRFATAADAAGSTEYTDGVTQTGTPGTAGAFTRITVPHDAPDTLHYYCTNHNGMGGPTANTTDANIADPFAWKCILAIPGYGDTADVSHIINHTTTQRTITLQGNTAVTFEKSNSYGGCIVNDASSTMKCTNPASTLANSTGPWTIEFWFNPDDVSGTTYMFSASNSMNFFSAGGCGFESDFGGSLWGGLNSTITTKKWQHFAGTRDGNTVRFFKDGQLINTATASGVNSAETEWTWGANGSNSQNSNGYFQDMRVYFGVAKYTDSFICPSSDPDLFPYTPSGTVHTTDYEKPNTGSVTFDGSNDFLTWASSADYAYGTGDFTWEAWIYANSFSSNRYVFDHGSNGGTISNGGSGAAQMLYFNSTIDSSGPLHATGFGTLNTERWYHLAASRQSGTTRLYRDGQLTAQDADTHNYGSQALSVGRHGGGGNTFNGSISNVRLIKGTALYTSNFKPPTEPLTAVTNTSLLCCQSIESPTVGEVTPGTINANGNPTASTFNPVDNSAGTMFGEATAYCTLNPLQTGASYTLSRGNLAFTSGSDWDGSCGSISVSSGKWYYEMTRGPGTSGLLGWCRPENYAITTEPGDPANSSVWRYRDDGTKRNGEGAGQAYGATWTTTGTVVGCSLDLDEGTIRFHVEGQDQGIAYSNLAGHTLCPVVGFFAASDLTHVNFGQRPFKYQPPKGFKSVNLANAAKITSKVANYPDNYFKVLPYTGSGASRTITDLNFQPDMIWFKIRSSSDNHAIYDSLRGVQKRIQPNTVGSQGADQTQAVSSFNSNGWSMGSDSQINGNSPTTYVAWCWKAGDTDTITYTVKVVSDSGNKYRFNDFGTSAVTLELREGRTFIFDQSDASNGPHPLRFSTTSDGTHGGGSEFTTGVTVEGVPGNAGARTIITVPAGTATLHYYCTAHPGMGGQANTPERGTSNFDGGIQSTVETNTTAGFSITRYTGNGSSGSTVGHGLTQAPAFIMTKSLDETGSPSVAWGVFHKDGSFNNDMMYFMLDAQQDAHTNVYTTTTQTDQHFTIGDWPGINQNGTNYISYIWHDVPGFQKFGSYRGLSVPAFVYCGFKPAFVILKRANGGGGHWVMYDSARPDNVTNPCEDYFFGNEANAENPTTKQIDILSDGFRIVTIDGDIIADNDTYIYMAWAEAPSMNLYGAQATAR